MTTVRPSPPPDNMALWWKKASDESNHHDPLRVAILYESFAQEPDVIGCGHEVSMASMVQRFQEHGRKQQPQLPKDHRHNQLSSSSSVVTTTTTCPVCQRPVRYITDGSIRDLPTVMFRYDKLTFRISVPTRSYLEAHQSSSWMNWLYHVTPSGTNTAQARIAQVLGLRLRTNNGRCVDEMKILYKGKVLYPPHSQPSSSFCSSEQDKISQMLLDYSAQNMTDHNNNKACLLVMGTPARLGLGRNQSKQGSWFRQCWYTVLDIGQRMVWMGYTWTIGVVSKLVVEPSLLLLGFGSGTPSTTSRNRRD